MKNPLETSRLMINSFLLFLCCIFFSYANAKTGISVFMGDHYSQSPILMDDKTLAGDLIKNQAIDTAKTYSDMIAAHLIKKTPYIVLSSVFALSIISSYRLLVCDTAKK